MTARIGHPAPPIGGTAYIPGSATPRMLDPQELAGGWVALVFYRGDFTVGTPAVLRGYAEVEPAFVMEAVQLVAASTDSFWSHKAWFESSPLLAGVRYPVVADTARRLTAGFGALAADGTALPAAFLVDADGVLRHAAAGDAARPAETLRALRSLPESSTP